MPHSRSPAALLKLMLLSDRSLSIDALCDWLASLGLPITRFAVATARRSFLTDLRLIEEHTGQKIKTIPVPDYLEPRADEDGDNEPPKPKKKRRRDWNCWPND